MIPNNPNMGLILSAVYFADNTNELEDALNDLKVYSDCMSLFDSIREHATDVEFNPSWCSNIGYLGNAVYDQSITELSRAIDERGRKILIIPGFLQNPNNIKVQGGLTNLVIFQRYPGHDQTRLAHNSAHYHSGVLAPYSSTHAGVADKNIARLLVTLHRALTFEAVGQPASPLWCAAVSALMGDK